MPANEFGANRFGLWRVARVLCVALWLLAPAPPALASSDAPQWMHALVGVTLPSYDEKTNAVLLYSETNVTVLSTDRIRTHVREAYKILRPQGRERGTVSVYFDQSTKITSMHGWCIPAQGKDYEVKEKEALDRALPFDGGELVDEVRARELRIPAPDPGNIIGYEYEMEQRPFWLQDDWEFQEVDPVRESHYSIQLPPGWVFKTSWMSHPEVKPDEGSGNVLHWVVRDVPGIRPEPDMPPRKGVAGQMIVSFFPSGGTANNNEFTSWEGLSRWEEGLIRGRMDPSDPIKHKVSDLTATRNTQLQKMQAIAGFVQRDIRYVAIELGIGGWQPHAAPEVFSHKYGDCKDKATLMRSMLHEIGVDSFLIVINTERGAVTRDSPACDRGDQTAGCREGFVPDSRYSASQTRTDSILRPDQRGNALRPDRWLPAGELWLICYAPRRGTSGVAPTAVGDE